MTGLPRLVTQIKQMLSPSCATPIRLGTYESTFYGTLTDIQGGMVLTVLSVTSRYVYWRKYSGHSYNRAQPSRSKRADFQRLVNLGFYVLVELEEELL